MGKKCNLELCLFPTGGADSSLGSSYSGRSKSEESAGSSRQLTIFYNGRVCIFDATEAQARAILCLAKREMEEKLGELIVLTLLQHVNILNPNILELFH